MKLNWKRHLFIFMLSQTISMLGSSIVSLALIWHVTLQTNSGIAITGITLTTFLPQALVMLVGGVIADRFPLKRIIIISDTFIAISTICLAVLYASGYQSILWIYIFNCLRSLGGGIQMPATKSILPEFIPQEALMKANSYSTTTWSIVQLIAPALAGIALSMLSLSMVLLIDVATAMIGIGLLFFVPVVLKRKQSKGNSITDLKIGFQYLRSSKKLKIILILYAVFQFLVVPASQLTPLLASNHLGDELWILTSVEVAFSVGAILGSIWLGIKKITLSYIKLLGYSVWIFSLAMGCIIFTESVWLFALCMLIMGIGSPIYYTPIITMVQEYSEPQYMGRIFSYVDLFSTIATPLGMLVFAPLSKFNLFIPFILPSIGLLLVGIWIFKNENKILTS